MPGKGKRAGQLPWYQRAAFFALKYSVAALAGYYFGVWRGSSGIWAAYEIVTAVAVAALVWELLKVVVVSRIVQVWRVASSTVSRTGEGYAPAGGVIEHRSRRRSIRRVRR